MKVIKKAAEKAIRTFAAFALAATMMPASAIPAVALDDAQTVSEIQAGQEGASDDGGDEGQEASQSSNTSESQQTDSKIDSKFLNETLPLQKGVDAQSEASTNNVGASTEDANSDENHQNSLVPLQPTKAKDASDEQDTSNPEIEPIEILNTSVPINDNAGIVISSNGMTYTINDDGSSVTLVGAEETNPSLSTTLSVPESIISGETSYSVTAIAPSSSAIALASSLLAENATETARATALAEATAAQSQLLGITSISIPASVCDIDTSAFAAFPNLEKIVIAPENPSYVSIDGILYARASKSSQLDSEAYPDSLELMYVPEGHVGCAVLHSNTCAVAPAALLRAYKLTGVSFESDDDVNYSNASLKAFNGSIFSNDGRTLLQTPAGMTSVFVRNTTEAIAEGAFYGCVNLGTVVFEGTAIEMPQASKSSDDKWISLPALPDDHDVSIVENTVIYGDEDAKNGVQMQPSQQFEQDGFVFTLIEDGGLAVSLGDNSGEEIVVPAYASYEGVQLPVRELAAGAMRDNSQLKAVSLPDTLISIGLSAFSGCAALERIDLPKGLQEISAHAFDGCANLSRLVLPSSIARIGEGAFANIHAATIVDLGCAADVALNALVGSTEVTVYAPVESSVWEGVLGLPAQLNRMIVYPSSWDAGSFSVVADSSITLPGFPEAVEGCKTELSYTGHVNVSESGELRGIRPGSVSVTASIVLQTPSNIVSSDSSGEDSDGIILSEVTWKGIVEVNAPVEEALSFAFSWAGEPLESKTVTGVLEDGENWVTQERLDVVLDVPEDYVTWIEALNEKGFEGDVVATLIREKDDAENRVLYACMGAGVGIPAETTLGRAKEYQCEIVLFDENEFDPTDYEWLDESPIATFGMMERDVSAQTDATLDKLTFAYEANTDSYSVGPNGSPSGDIVIPATYDDGTHGSKDVTVIRDNSFSTCRDIKTVTIPSTVNSLAGGSPFDGCSSLTHFYVSSANPTFTSIDGVLYTLDANGRPNILTKWPNNNPSKLMDIPDGVVKIADSATFDTFNVEQVQIPSSVTTIDGWFMCGAYKLKSLYIPDTVKSLSGYYLCGYLGSFQTYDTMPFLTQVTLPSCLQSLTGGAFQKTSAIKSITYLGESSVSFANECFSSIQDKTAVAIGLKSTASKKSWEDKGFTNFEFIDQKVKFQALDTNPVTLKVFPLNSSIAGDVIIPARFTGTVTAANGSGAITVTNAAVTTIVNNAFSTCNKITSVTIPASITDVGDNGPFDGCWALTSITVDPGNTHYRSIHGVLYSLDADGELNSLLKWPNNKPDKVMSIPEGVKSISNSATFNCLNVENVVIPSSVTEIGPYFMCNAPKLKGLTIPSTVNAVDSDYLCGNYGDNSYVSDHSMSALTSFTRNCTSDSTSTIIGTAFTNCTGLQAITYQSDVSSIAVGAFANVPKETCKVYIPGTASKTAWISAGFLDANILTTDSNLVYSVVETVNGVNQLAVWPRNDDIAGSVIISENVVNGTKKGSSTEKVSGIVTTIGSNAFSNCGSITSVSISKSVTSIDFQGAFDACTMLESFDVDPLNEYFSSYQGVLYKRDGENSLHTLYKWPPNKADTTMSIPDGVVEIQNGATFYCRNVKRVSFPSTLRTIQKYFMGISPNLEALDIPDYVTSVDTDGMACTYSHSQLDGLKMDKLSSVTLPVSVNSIGDSAFEVCSSLMDIYAKGIVKSISKNTSYGINKAFNGLPLASDGKHYATRVHIPANSTDDDVKIWTDAGFLAANVIKEGLIITFQAGTDAHFTTSDNPPSLSTTMFAKNVLLSEALVPVPVREGYSIEGWYTAEVGGSKWDFATMKFNADQTLWAHWKINQYKAAFDVNEGLWPDETVDVRQEEGDYNTTVPAQEQPTRTGYVFKGWSTDKTATAGSTDLKFVAADTTYYAAWEPIKYTVTFNKNHNDAIGTMGSQEFTYDVESKLNPNTFERKGYVFSGWAFSTDGENAYDDEQLVLNLRFEPTTVSLYAIWSAGTYKLSFDASGGEGGENRTLDAVYDSVLPEINKTEPTRDGYDFAGWYDGSGVQYYSKDGNAVKNKWDVDSNVTLVAHWTPLSAKIVFDPNGGSAVPDMEGKTGDSITDRTMPLSQKKGYTLEGWYSTSDLSGEKASQLPEKYPPSQTKYYAKWASIKYKVKFEAEGIPVPNECEVEYDADFVVPNDIPLRAGYEFLGWSLSENADSADYEVSQTYKNANLAETEGAVVTLHAAWSGNSYTVLLENYGCGGLSSITVTMGKAMPKIDSVNLPVQPQFTFAGYWSTEDESGTKYYDKDGQSVVEWDQPSDNVKLYAHWQSASYLKYVYDNSTDSYWVQPLNNDISGDIIIPAKYNGPQGERPVMGVAYNAFSLCKKVTTISMSSEIIYLGNDSDFDGCDMLTAFYVDSANPKYMSIDGALYEKDPVTKNPIKLVKWPNNHPGKVAIIPNTVTELMNSSTFSCNNLEEIVIPPSVKTIRAYFLSGCPKITTIDIPDTVENFETSYLAGYHSFLSPSHYYMPDLKYVTFGSSVTSLGNDCLSSASGLETIYVRGKITSIDSRQHAWGIFAKLPKKANSDKYSTKVYLLASDADQLDVDLWKSWGFEDVYLSDDKLAFTSNGDGTLSVWPKDNNIEGPVIIPEHYEGIGREGDTVSGDVTTIGVDAFSSCTKITSVALPKTITSIDESGAFDGCTSLAMFNVDDENQKFASYACALYSKDADGDASELVKWPAGRSDVTFTVPSTVKKIWSYSVVGCKSITSVTIPESVLEIGEGFLADCAEVKDFAIPDTVTTIDTKNLAGHNSNVVFESADYSMKLKDVSLGKCITRIDAGAFTNCSSLANITLRGIVSTIAKDEDTFKNLPLDADGVHFSTKVNMSNESSEADKNVWIEAGFKLENIIAMLANLVFTDNGDGTLSVWPKNDNITGPVMIPETVVNAARKGGGTISGTVTSIGNNNSFSRCRFITSVSIPKTVTFMEDGGSFDACTNLSSFEVDSQNPYFASINGVLYKKTNGVADTLLRWPPAFPSTTFSLPEGITKIDNSAVFYCPNLKMVAVPASVITISPYFLSNCMNVEAVEVPDTVTNFDSNYFLGDYTGYSWASGPKDKLKSLTLGVGVKSIPATAIIDTPILSNIYVKGTVSSIAKSGAFSECPKNIVTQKYSTVVHLPSDATADDINVWVNANFDMSLILCTGTRITFDATDGRFNINGESVQTYSTTTFTSNYIINEPAQPIYQGYVVEGWYKDESLTEKWNFSTDRVNSNVTLRAKWIAALDTPYTVKYWLQNLDGDAAAHDENNYTLGSTDALTGETLSIPKPEPKAMAGFVAPPVDETTPIAADGSTTIDYYYTWIGYNITYNLNGGALGEGVSNPSGDNAYCIVSDDITLSNPSKDGYTFTGWTVEGARGEGTTVSGTTTVIKKGTYGDLTITANFAADDVAVKFSLGNWSGSEQFVDSFEKTIKWDGTGDVNAFASPGTSDVTRTGYILKGWSMRASALPEGASAATGKDYLNPGLSGQTGNLTTKYVSQVVYDADWEAFSYTVTFDANLTGDLDTTSITPSSIPAGTWTYASTDYAFPAVARDGYALTAWNEKPDGTGKSWSTSGDKSAFTPDYAPTAPANTSARAITLYAIWAGNSNVNYTIEHYQEALDPSADPKYVKVEPDTELLGNAGVANAFELSALTQYVKNDSGFTYESGKTEINCKTADGKVVIRGDGTTVVKFYYSRNSFSVTMANLDDIRGIKAATATPNLAGTTVAAVRYGDTVDLAATLPDTGGYNFKQWTVAKSDGSFALSNITGKNELSASFVMPAYDVTVWPSADPLSYTIKFDYTNGKQSGASWNGQTDAQVTQASVWDGDSNGWTMPGTLEAAGVSQNPDVTGYIFKGWSSQQNSSTVEFAVGETWGVSGSEHINITDNYPTDGRVTLYAVWTPREYEVTFNANNGKFTSGEGAGSAQRKVTHVYDSETTVPTDVARTGYKLSSWNTKADGTGDVLALSGKIEGKALTGAKTYYAVWTNNKFTIEYVDENNAVANAAAPNVGTDASATVAGNRLCVTYTFRDANDTRFASQNIPAIGDSFTRTGYNPATEGWVYSADVRYTAAAPISDTTLLALYNAAGGDSAASDEARVMQLKADWTDKQWTVSYGNLKPGSAAEIVIPESFKSYKYSEGLTLPTADNEFMAYTGWMFGGWYSNAECTGSAVTAIAGNAESELGQQQFWAKWTPVSYTVVFDGNKDHGLSGETLESDVAVADDAVKSLGLTYDSHDKNVPAEGYSAIGYELVGWSTEKTFDYAAWKAAQDNGSDFDMNGAYFYPVQGTSGATITDNLSAESGEVPLYAIWAMNSYELRFEATWADNVEFASVNPGANVSSPDYATSSTSPRTATYTEAFAMPSNKPTRLGYELAGWALNMDEADSNKIFSASNCPAPKNLITAETSAAIILKPVWKAKSNLKIVYSTGSEKASLADPAQTFGTWDAAKHTLTSTYTFNSSDMKLLLVGSRADPSGENESAVLPGAFAWSGYIPSEFWKMTSGDVVKNVREGTSVSVSAPRTESGSADESLAKLDVTKDTLTFNELYRYFYVDNTDESNSLMGMWDPAIVVDLPVDAVDMRIRIQDGKVEDVAMPIRSATDLDSTLYAKVVAPVNDSEMSTAKWLFEPDGADKNEDFPVCVEYVVPGVKDDGFGGTVDATQHIGTPMPLFKKWGENDPGVVITSAEKPTSGQEIDYDESNPVVHIHDGNQGRYRTILDGAIRLTFTPYNDTTGTGVKWQNRVDDWKLKDASGDAEYAAGSLFALEWTVKIDE